MSLIRARYRAVNTIMNLPRGGYVGLLDLFPNAAAAYSLRKLRAAYSGAAVRVRRSSDNTEQDIAFDANGDLDTASLLSFVNADVNTFVSDFANSESIIELGGTGQSNQSIGGRTGLYKFTYTGGATAHQAYLSGKHPDSNNTYSVIFNIYFPTGQACNGFSYLKPDGTSDTNHNLTQGVWHSFSYTDINGGSNLSRFIPSVNGVANTADDGANFYLDAWVITQTSADGFVTVWYDQSLSNDATQTTASNQPKIVSAGSLVTENGKPAVDFDGVDDYFVFTTPTTLSGEFFVTTALNCDPVGTGSTLLNNQTGFNDRLRLYSTGNIEIRNSGSLYNYTLSFTPNTQSLLTIQRDSVDSIEIYVNSSSKGANTDGNDWTDILGYLGSNQSQAAGLFYNGNIQEFIAYNLDESANRTAIETNINTFYSIYP